MTDDQMLDAVRKLSDRNEIADLAARYAFGMDSQDIDDLLSLFTADAEYGSDDGTHLANSHNDLKRVWNAVWSTLGYSNHFIHQHLITPDPDCPDRATGVVSAHTEVARDGTASIVGMRYHDTYVRQAGIWKFSRRRFRIFYVAPIDQYNAILSAIPPLQKP